MTTKELLDHLIDEEGKMYERYGDNRDICTGIKLMADRIRECYDKEVEKE